MKPMVYFSSSTPVEELPGNTMKNSALNERDSCITSNYKKKKSNDRWNDNWLTNWNGQKYMKWAGINEMEIDWHTTTIYFPTTEKHDMDSVHDM